jgi:RND family efflux transporter MFP subunit
MPPPPLFLAALALLPATPPAPRQGPPPAPVRVAEARLERVQDRRTVTGEVRAARRSLVAAREPGIVSTLLVREGQAVEAGQPLAELDATLLERELAILGARRALADATLSEREASARRERRDLDVLGQLAERDAVNPKELADAETALQIAEARVEEARQELAVLGAQRALLEQRVADMTPRAPFDGVVVARRTDAGEWVDTGGALVEIVSAGELEAWLWVPQVYYAPLSGLAEPLRLRTDAGGVELEVLEWRAVPSIDAGGRTFPVIAPLPGERGLAPGMSLRAAVPTGSPAEHLTVPRDAILRGEVGAYVYLARPGAEGAPASATPIPLEVLFEVGPRAAVRAPGLAPGALVVVEGNERLYPGAPLAPRQDGGR